MRKQRAAEGRALEKGVWGRNLLKVSPQLARPISSFTAEGFRAVGSHKISVAPHGAHIFDCRSAGANCLKSPRLKV